MQEKLEPTKLPYQEKKDYVDLLEEIILQIVDHHGCVQVDEVEAEGEDVSIAFIIKVDKSDRGKVIGRQGTTIGSLHKLFAVISRKFVKINIVDYDTDEPVR